MTEKVFRSNIKRVMRYMGSSDLTVADCREEDIPTPCDRIIMIHLNGGVECGFRIPGTVLEKMYQYIVKHKQELIDLDLISPSGYNSWGVVLWDEYKFENKLF